MKIKEAIIWLAILAVLISAAVYNGDLLTVMALAFACSAMAIRLVAAIALMGDGGVGGPPRARPKCKPRPGKTIRIVPNIIDPPHECGSSQRIPIRPFLVASTQEMEDAISVGLADAGIQRDDGLLKAHAGAAQNFVDDAGKDIETWLRKKIPRNAYNDPRLVRGNGVDNSGLEGDIVMSGKCEGMSFDRSVELLNKWIAAKDSTPRHSGAGVDNSDLNDLLKMATRQQTTPDTYPDW